MEKTIIIRITNPTKAQDALLQRLIRVFRAEHIEVQENTAFTLLSGNLQIDPQRRLVWQAGQAVDLTPMEFDILLLLARRPGQVFSARQIYIDFAKEAGSSPETVRKAIRELQQQGVVEKTRRGYFVTSDKAAIITFRQQYLASVEKEYHNAKEKVEI